MERRLIAESGGSKTDWCLMEDGHVVQRFESVSLHPLALSSELVEQIKTLLENEIGNLEGITLEFYGAGCFQIENQSKLQNFFNSIGVDNCTIASDLIAAGKIFQSDTPIWVGILGTGSVLFNYFDGKILEIIGGQGFQNGDEGSGYYFGRLIVQAYIKNELNKQQRLVVTEKCDMTSMINLFESGKGKFEIASLSMRLSSNYELFKEFHYANYEVFYEKHLAQSQIKELYLVGGYGFHNRLQLSDFLGVKGVRLMKVINRPLDLLIEQSASNGD